MVAVKDRPSEPYTISHIGTQKAADGESKTSPKARPLPTGFTTVIYDQSDDKPWHADADRNLQPQWPVPEILGRSCAEPVLDRVPSICNPSVDVPEAH